MKYQKILDDANKIVFIGYSLPQYDETAYKLFRYICSPLRIRQKEITVMNKSITPQMVKMYNSLNSDTLFLEMSFRDFINTEAERLNREFGIQ